MKDPAVGRAPRTLVITMESNTEEQMETRARRIKRSLDMGQEKMEAFDIIRKQIHDIGELEDAMDDDEKQRLRRHIIGTFIMLLKLIP